MINIVLLLLITIVAHSGFIGTIIYQFARKPDYYVLKILFCMVCIIFLFVYDLPYLRDIVEQETTVTVVEYIDFQSSNTRPGSRKLFFENKNGRISLVTPTITRTVAQLEPGKTYEIEYFNHSKVIKSYKLIE